jgi:hypothetical protein
MSGGYGGVVDLGQALSKPQHDGAGTGNGQPPVAVRRLRPLAATLDARCVRSTGRRKLKGPRHLAPSAKGVSSQVLEGEGTCGPRHGVSTSKGSTDADLQS